MATHVYSIGVNWNIGGQFATNVLHYQFDDSGFPSTADAARALNLAFSTANQTAFLNAVSVHTTLLSYRARCVNAAGGFEALRGVAGGTVGARAGNLGYAGLAPVILMHPVANGKQRGRIFLPGCSDADCLDGYITAAFNTVMGSLITALLAPITLVGGGAPVAQYCIYNRVTRVGTLADVGLVSPMLGQVRRRQLPV
jgi:hypothetical protein